MFSPLIDIISHLKVKDLVKLANDFGFETKGLIKQDLVDILQTIPSLHATVNVEGFDLTKKARLELMPLPNTPWSSVSNLNSQVSRPVIKTDKYKLENIIPFLKIDDLRLISQEFFIKSRGVLKKDLEDTLMTVLPYQFLQEKYEISQFDITEANLRKLKMLSVPTTPYPSPRSSRLSSSSSSSRSSSSS
jgi:hypothetical protein